SPPTAVGLRARPTPRFQATPYAVTLACAPFGEKPSPDSRGRIRDLADAPLPLIDLHPAPVIGHGLAELVRPVVPRDEEEISRLLGREHGLQRGQSGIGDRTRR